MACSFDPFVELCKAASEGTTNRVRIKEDRFLDQQITLPPLAEQQAIVTRLDSLTEKTRQLEAHLDAVEPMPTSARLAFAPRLPIGADRKMCGDCTGVRRDAAPSRLNQHLQVGVRGFGGGLFAKTGNPAAGCGI
ncbi:MAG: restriction endonuclease subunit S [Betaproteobacteria bacterium]|nr:restriction endonuclease subunit S [Betaproteobacteria bacterium]